MAEEAGQAEEGKRKKKPKRHTPSRRGHSPKSLPSLKERFRQKAARKRQRKEEELRKQWADWDALPDEVKTLRKDLTPKGPRPEP